MKDEVQSQCDKLCEKMNIAKTPGATERTLGMLQKKYEYFLNQQQIRQYEFSRKSHMIKGLWS